MESAARFLRSRPDEGGGGADEQSAGQLLQQQQEEEVPCVLDIFVHEARGIHNICIYGDQDVYARLALTSAPDDDGGAARATRVARGGGATPRFAERLPPLRVPRGRIAVDVLKCELWMRSCARGVLDDQLLGFALVPLAAVAAADGATIVEADFELSSTDLLHSPAGIVRLSLALRPDIPEDDACDLPAGRGADAEPSIASEVVILGPAPPVDYSRIEFTDLRVEQENDAMAVQYLPFLRTGETVLAEDCEMSTSPRARGEKSSTAAASSDGSISRNAAASTASTVSEDRAVSSSAEAAEKPKPPPHDVDEAATAPVSRRSPDTPTSRGGEATKADVFTSPLGDMDMDIDMEAEQSAMQRQIMEMYLKSMQQFSESLAKMQLPIELGRGDGIGSGVQKEETPDKKKVIERQQAKKDGARVFYGSRAFF